MKKLLNTLFLFFFTLFCSSCIEKTIDLELPEGLYAGDKMVLNGYVSSDSGCIVKVSKSSPSVGAFTYDQLKFRDARVFLYENGDSILELKGDATGVFSFKAFQPKVGARYKIRATSSVLPSCESEEEIFSTAFQTSEVKPYIKDSLIFGRPAVLFPIKIYFDKAKINYFVTDEGNFSLLGDIRAPFSENACDSYYFGLTAGYSTKCFQSGDTLNFVYDYKLFSDIPKSITLALTTVSPSFYKYAKVMNQPKGFETAFVEPNTIYTNIIGGYGLFYTKNSKKFTYFF